MNRKGYTYDYEKDIYTDWQGNLMNMPDFQLPEPTNFMSAKSYKTKLVEPLIEKQKKSLKDITTKYYDMRDLYYGFKGEIDELRDENSYLKRRNQDLREEVTVLKEDVKDLRALKKALGSKRIDELVRDAGNEYHHERGSI